jgi:hypothetical protein
VLNEPNWTKALSTRLRDGIRGWTGSAPILWVGKRSKCRTVAGGLSAFCHDPLHDRDGFGVLVVGVVLPEQFVPRSALIGPLTLSGDQRVEGDGFLRLSFLNVFCRQPLSELLDESGEGSCGRSEPGAKP